MKHDSTSLSVRYPPKGKSPRISYQDTFQLSIFKSDDISLFLSLVTFPANASFMLRPDFPDRDEVQIDKNAGKMKMPA